MDSLNRQFARSEVQIVTSNREYKRKSGFVLLSHDTLHIRSSVLFDTLRISLDSVRTIQCYEYLPVGTILAATAGGGVAGYLIGKATSDKVNTQLPIGFSVIGATLAGVGAYSSNKETLYFIDQDVGTHK